MIPEVFSDAGIETTSIIVRLLANNSFDINQKIICKKCSWLCFKMVMSFLIAINESPQRLHPLFELPF